MTPLRLAYVQSHLFYGSVESYLRSLIEGIDRERFEPWLVCPDHQTLEPLRTLPQLEGRVVPVPPGAGLPAFAWTRGRALRAIGPALVHCPDFDPPAMLTSRLTRTSPLVVTYNTPELQPAYNAIGRAAVKAAWS